MVASIKVEIHVSSILPNKHNHLAFIQAKNFHILITLSCRRHHHNYKLMDSWADSKQSKFIKQQETIGLTRSFGIKTRISKISLVGPLSF